MLTVLIQHQSELKEVEYGLATITKARRCVEIARKGSELDFSNEQVKALLKFLDQKENLLKSEANMRRYASMSAAGKNFTIGLIAIGAIALVTYGVISARQRFRK